MLLRLQDIVSRYGQEDVNINILFYVLGRHHALWYSCDEKDDCSNLMQEVSFVRTCASGFYLL